MSATTSVTKSSFLSYEPEKTGKSDANCEKIADLSKQILGALTKYVSSRDKTTFREELGALIQEKFFDSKSIERLGENLINDHENLDPQTILEDFDTLETWKGEKINALVTPLFKAAVQKISGESAVENRIPKGFVVEVMERAFEFGQNQIILDTLQVLPKSLFIDVVDPVMQKILSAEEVDFDLAFKIGELVPVDLLWGDFSKDMRLLEIGRAALKKGKFEFAEKALKLMTGRNDLKYDLYRLIGVFHVQKGDISKAVSILEIIEKETKRSNSQLAMEIGFAVFQMPGLIDLAFSMLEKIPQGEGLASAIAERALEEGNIELARKTLSKAGNYFQKIEEAIQKKESSLKS